MPDNRGGRREGSGVKTFFRGKSYDPRTADPLFKNVPHPTSILLTAKGRKILDRTVRRLTKDWQTEEGNKKLRVSRNVVNEALLRLYAGVLTLKQIRRAEEL